jgi:hypothetical protein
MFIAETERGEWNFGNETCVESGVSKVVYKQSKSVPGFVSWHRFVC